MLQSAKTILRPNKDKERLKHACSFAVTVLHATLKIIKQITDDVGIKAPGLHAGLNGIFYILEAIQVGL
jgi:hypothetical protein